MNPLTTESVLIHSDDIVSREIEGELLIVPIASGIGDMEDELYTMNATGKCIWQLINGIRTIGEIVTELSNNYSGSTDEITKDVLGISGELVNRKILLIRG